MKTIETLFKKAIIIVIIFCASLNVLNGQTQYHSLFNDMPNTFNNYDLDNNGTISVSEATAMLNQIGQDTGAIQKQFDFIDSNLDTVLQMAEFGRFLVLLWRESVKPAIDMQEAQNGFTLFDPDGNGEATVSEIDAAIQKAGHNGGASGQDYIQQFDTDASNSLSLNEYLPLAYPWAPPAGYLQAKEEFRVFDPDGNNFATQTEFQSMNLPASQIEGIIQQSDVDSDGKISFAEFCFTAYPPFQE